MSSIKVVIAIVTAVVLTAAATYLAGRRTVKELAGQNQSLRQQLQQAETDRKAAQARADARELELQKVRSDTLELQRLREELKTNSHPAALPTGFYVGTDQPIYVTYGTADPMLRSLIRALMNDSTNAMAKGQAIFEKTCAACHQRDGLGKVGVAPPLVGSEWVLEPGGQRLARIVLNGLSGPVTVQGRVWNLAMPPWRENLDDDAIAVTLSYIRSSLGTNKATDIRPDLVTTARQELHPGPESAAELMQLSAQ
ncbi:MAG TPA: cytochrome c [Verrucomicrobiae bacterium]|nr:cytochrome c [Verrucomicrobiae bacterium]